MISTSTTYKNILEGNHRFETKIVVGQTTYGEDQIMSCERSQTLFAGDYGIGGAVMNQISFSLIGVTAAQLPSMSRVEVWTRAVSEDGSTSSEWLPMGIYYTKKPDYDPESEILSVMGYDEMWRTGVVPWEVGAAITAWVEPTIRSVALHLTEGTTDETIETSFAGIGLPLEDDTQVPDDILLTATPFNFTVREILSEIAVASCGNWVVVFSSENDVQTAKLRLVRMVDFPEVGDPVTWTDLGRDIVNFTKGDPIPPVTNVRVYYGYGSDGAALYVEAYSEPDDGRKFDIELKTILDGVQVTSVAQNILEGLGKEYYNAIDAGGCSLDPAQEIGDPITANGVSSILGSITTEFSRGMWANISAPGIPQDDEFPDLSSSAMQTERQIAENAANSTKLTVMDGEIRAEITRATASEDSTNEQLARLVEELQAEISRAEGAEDDIQNSIAQVVTVTLNELGITESIGSLQEAIDAIIAVQAYIKSGIIDYTSDNIPVVGVEVGQTNTVDGVEVFSKFARFTADGVYFYLANSEDPIAWMSGQTLHITNAEVTSTFKLGGYMANTSSGVAFKWVGV